MLRVLQASTVRAPRAVAQAALRERTKDPRRRALARPGELVGGEYGTRRDQTRVGRRALVDARTLVTFVNEIGAIDAQLLSS